MILKSCKKKYTFDQDKVIHPKETIRIASEKLEKYNLSLSKTFFEIKTHFDFLQYRVNTSASIYNMVNIRGANGKGITHEQAKANCVMKPIERYSAKIYGR